MESEREVVERRAELQIQTKKGSLSFPLPEASSFLGTSDEAQISLEDEALEPRHLEFDWDGNELWLIYLGKGVRPAVNGELSSEARLFSGDQVEIGDVSVRVRILRRTVRRRGPVPAEQPQGPEVPPAGEAAGEDRARAVTEAEKEAPEEPVPPEEQVLLEFTVHQLTQQPRKGVIVGALLVAFLVLVWFFLVPNNPTMLVISAVIILGSVSAFIFPLRYRLTEAGVEIKGVLIRDFKRWERFERFRVYPDAVQLFVPQRSLRGRVVKGTLIYFRDNREEVMAIIRDKIAAAGNQNQ